MAVTAQPPEPPSRFTAVQAGPGPRALLRRVHSPTGDSASDSASRDFMIGIIGKKLGMTQLFNEAGQQIPVHGDRGRAEPGARGHEHGEGWHASVQLGGIGVAAHRRASRRRASARRVAVARTRRSSGTRRRPASRPPPRVLRSFRLDEPGNAKAEIPTYNVGDVVKVDIFAVGRDASRSPARRRVAASRAS